MQVYAVQHDIVWEDKPANHATVRRLVEQAGMKPGSLVVLAEMFATGFSMNLPVLDEGVTRASETFAAGLANHLQSTVIAGVVNVSPTTGRGLNQSVAFTADGREAARYTKMQPFSPGHESEHYDSGDEPVVFSVDGVSIAPFICYDLRFPEVFRLVTRRAPQVITVIASWPVARIEHWVTLLKARAIENQAFVVGVNRIGADPALQYNGRSMIVDPLGNVLADAGDRECVISAELDLHSQRDYRARLPFLADIRDDVIVAASPESTEM